MLARRCITSLSIGHSSSAIYIYTEYSNPSPKLNPTWLNVSFSTASAPVAVSHCFARIGSSLSPVTTGRLLPCQVCLVTGSFMSIGLSAPCLSAHKVLVATSAQQKWSLRRVTTSGFLRSGSLVRLLWSRTLLRNGGSSAAKNSFSFLPFTFRLVCLLHFAGSSSSSSFPFCLTVVCFSRFYILFVFVCSVFCPVVFHALVAVVALAKDIPLYTLLSAPTVR